MFSALDQFQIFRLLDYDASSWIDLRCYPGTPVLRAMLALADWSVAAPRRYAISKLRYEQPELSYRELTVLAQSCRSYVCDCCRPQIVRAAETALLDGDDKPDIPVSQDPGGREHSRTYLRGVELCGIAQSNPDRWRVWSAFSAAPDVAGTKLAVLTGVSQSSVSRYLAELSTYAQHNNQ